MPRQHSILRTAPFLEMVFSLVVGSSALAADEEAPADAEKKSPVYQEMIDRLSQVKVSTVGGEQLKECEFRKQPVFRYSDQEREIDDATLWLWTDKGRPIALEKEEACAFRQRPQWTVCWASLSPGLVKVDWNRNGRGFTTTRPGCEFKPVPNGPAPAKAASLVMPQLRQVSKRFAATFDEGKTEGRIIPKPIYEYSSTTHGIVAGAVFGLSAYGTNPDGYLVIELHKSGDQHEWLYGCARMTTTAIDVSLDGEKVWSCPVVDTSTIYRENWTFFFEPRPTAAK